MNGEYTNKPIAPNRYMAMESGERYSELLRQDEEIGRLRVALQDIKNMTDVDNPESYRSDDHEGCLDAVYETAFEALREDKEIGRLAVENARLARELGTERSGHLLTLGERNWYSKETDRLRLRVYGHAETLRGIASMNPATEGERMRQWALDGLSGYTESTDSTVKKLMDQIERLRAALEMLYGKWETGDSCWSDPESKTQYLGNAFDLTVDEMHKILALIEDFKTPQGEPALTVPGTREPVVTAPQGNAGESPASVSSRPWRGIVPHDPMECGPCDVEFREIERNIKPPLGGVSRHDATKFGGQHVELPDDDPPDRHFTMVNGEPK